MVIYYERLFRAGMNLSRVLSRKREHCTVLPCDPVHHVIKRHRVTALFGLHLDIEMFTLERSERLI